MSDELTAVASPQAQIPAYEREMREALDRVQAHERKIREALDRVQASGWYVRHCPGTIQMQPAYRDRLRGADRLSTAGEPCRRIITLPLHPEPSAPRVARTSSALSDYR